MFLEATLFILLMTAVSLLIQDKYNIPTPISLISIVITLKFFGIDFIEINNHVFDQILILMLPILISVDALSLKLSDIKKHGISLFYVAVVMVLLSTVAAVGLNKIILPDYHLSIASLTILFCMIMSTDPISVSAAFGKTKIPHDLKIIAEGESLFNDATALIMFAIGLLLLKNTNDVGVFEVTILSSKIIFLALIIGLGVGLFAIASLAITKNPKIETAILLATSFSSYIIAEKYQCSGILSVIVSMLTANYVITKRIEHDDAIINKKFTKRMLNKFNEAVKDKASQETVLGNIQYLALLGATILFISMAHLFNFEILFKYWKETLSVFIATTVIRMLMLAKFSLISNNIKKMQNISFHWWLVLSAAGVKGSISILMLHMLPKNFVYRELFEAIVVGNVILTTFIYPLALLIIMQIYKENFNEEYEKDL